MTDIEDKQMESGSNTEADQLLRLRADFANYKRRVEEQREEQIRHASEELIKRLLPVLDDLDRAVKNMPEEMEDEDWCKGVALVQRNLQLALVKEGILTLE